MVRALCKAMMLSWLNLIAYAPQSRDPDLLIIQERLLTVGSARSLMIIRSRLTLRHTAL
jgi:hypothetical protein